MFRRMIISLFIMGQSSAQAFCQVVPEGSEIQELIRIGESFRIKPFIAFNIHYAYSDSATWPTPVQEISATYRMSEGRYAAVIDSTELMQGTNFNLVVYHDSKVILVSEKKPVDEGLLQVSALDSLFVANLVDSMEVTTVNDSTRKLEIHFRPEAPFVHYEITYNPTTYLIRKVLYYQRSTGDEVENYSVIEAVFSNYSESPISDTYFMESKFIYRTDTGIMARSPYQDYEVIMNGAL